MTYDDNIDTTDAVLRNLWTATVMGWTVTFSAPNRTAALRYARDAAAGASLLPSDVTDSHIRPATVDDLDWYRSMGGSL